MFPGKRIEVNENVLWTVERREKCLFTFFGCSLFAFNNISILAVVINEAKLIQCDRNKMSWFFIFSRSFTESPHNQSLSTSPLCLVCDVRWFNLKATRYIQWNLKWWNVHSPDIPSSHEDESHSILIIITRKSERDRSKNGCVWMCLDFWNRER